MFLGSPYTVTGMNLWRQLIPDGQKSHKKHSLSISLDGTAKTNELSKQKLCAARYGWKREWRYTSWSADLTLNRRVATQKHKINKDIQKPTLRPHVKNSLLDIIIVSTLQDTYAEMQNYRRSHSSTMRLAMISASRALFSISIFSSSVWWHCDNSATLWSYNSAAVL